MTTKTINITTKLKQVTQNQKELKDSTFYELCDPQDIAQVLTQALNDNQEESVSVEGEVKVFDADKNAYLKQREVFVFSFKPYAGWSLKGELVHPEGTFRFWGEFARDL